MRILVTGTGGYIGSILAPSLAEAGHDVAGLDTSYFRGCDFGAPPAGFEMLDRDLRDVGADDLDGFDAVAHFGALSNDPLGDFDPALTHQINCDATLSLARAARDAGVKRFVFASSCSMYGASGSDDSLDESAPMRPLTAYAESKVNAERQLLGLADTTFEPVSMRNATVYGVSPRLRLDIVLNNLAAWGHTTGRIRLLSDGSAWRPLIHVRDVAKATLAMLEAPADVVRGEAFNVGSDEQNYLIRDLAELLGQITGCEVEMAEGSVADQRSYRVSFAKLNRAFPTLTLDWNARLGSEELVEAYKRLNLTAEDLEGDRYTRLKRLRHLLDAGLLDESLRWQPSARA